VILKGTTKAKAIIWFNTDIEKRKYREQEGLDTPVVYTVNDECYHLDFFR